MTVQTIKLEFNRLWGSLPNIAAIALFTLLMLVFVYSGISSYQDFQQEKALFQAHEKNKSDRYSTYGHYGFQGFGILLEASPLLIFFNNSSLFDNLHTHVDMSEVLDVTSSNKGRDLFRRKGLFKDPAGMFFMLGSLLMLFMGMTAFRSGKHFFRFSGLIIRLVLLEFYFMQLLILIYVIPVLWGIKFTTGDRGRFIYFSLYLLVFLAFFYGLGLAARVLFRNKRHHLLTALAAWFLCLVVVPELVLIINRNQSMQLPANQQRNMELLKGLTDFERKIADNFQGHYDAQELKTVYKKVMDDYIQTRGNEIALAEQDFNHAVASVISQQVNLQAIFPGTFFHYLGGELSGSGYRAYSELVTYTLAKRRRFVDFYLTGRCVSVPSGSFLKGSETVFFSTGHLPKKYATGFLLTLIYTTLLFLVSYYSLTRHKQPLSEGELPTLTFQPGQSYFVLCKDRTFKEKLFNFYKQSGAAICIDRVQPEEIDSDINLRLLMDYFISAGRVDAGKVRENLKLLGIDPDQLPGRTANGHNSVPDPVLYLYCAVLLAQPGEMVVFNDFLSRTSRNLERSILNMIALLNQSGKTVIYLGTELFLTALPFEDAIKNTGYRSFTINPRLVSLR